jgi:hypothetical protein
VPRIVPKRQAVHRCVQLYPGRDSPRIVHSVVEITSLPWVGRRARDVLMIEAESTELRTYIDRALAQARETNHSAYLRISLDADERARIALAAWTKALVESKARYAIRSSGRRAYRDRAGYERTEIDEIVIEVWPDGTDWVTAEIQSGIPHQSAANGSPLAP